MEDEERSGGGEICMEEDGMSGDYEDTVCVTEEEI